MGEDTDENWRRWRSGMKRSMQVGVSLVVVGILLLLADNTILNIRVYNNVILKNNSKAFEMWQRPPASVYRKYYFFDVQNPEEVITGKKPYLLERGPYVYKEVFEKKNVEFLDNGYVVGYSPVVTLFFEPSLSAGTESDTITFLNIPALGMIETAAKSEFSTYSIPMVNGVFKLFGTEFFIKRNISELITGYSDPILKMAKTFVPDLIKNDQFSLLNGQNGTIWQNYTMETGLRKPKEIAKIITWDDKKKLDIWNSKGANSFKGTDGTYFPPFLDRHATLYAFNPDMCRTYYLKYLKDSEVNGVKTYRFHLPQNIFWNSSLNPENDGYCDGDCLGNGVQNISKCYGGISSFISQPHFLNAEYKFLEAVSGLKPDRSKHDFILNFEPVSGVSLNGSIRFQINFFYTSDSRISLIKDVTPTLLPVVWFESSLELSKETIAELGQLNVISNLMFLVPFIIFLFGIVFVVVSLILLVIITTKEDRLYEDFDDQSERDGIQSRDQANYSSTLNAASNE